MIVYASRTGNNRFIVNQLNLPSIEITKNLLVNDDYFLLTYTDGLGMIPKVVSDFLVNNHQHCKGVIASGNTNFGQHNFCGSADKISELYNIPIIRKIELRGFHHDYDFIVSKYKEMKGE